MTRSHASSTARSLPDAAGHFGVYGGRYVAETLMPALLELEEAWAKLRRDAGFRRELQGWLRDYAGRPTRLYFARRLTDRLGGARDGQPGTAERKVLAEPTAGVREDGARGASLRVGRWGFGFPWSVPLGTLSRRFYAPKSPCETAESGKLR